MTSTMATESNLAGQYAAGSGDMTGRGSGRPSTERYSASPPWHFYASLYDPLHLLCASISSRCQHDDGTPPRAAAWRFLPPKGLQRAS
jgi:hypothetical protein